MSVYIFVVIILLIAMTISIVVLKTKLEETQAKLKSEREYINGLLDELAKMKEEMKIRREEKVNADAEIEKLHYGDTVDNAIDRLSKH